MTEKDHRAGHVARADGQSRLSRRQLLQGAVVLSGGGVLAGLIAACGSNQAVVGKPGGRSGARPTGTTAASRGTTGKATASGAAPARSSVHGVMHLGEETQAYTRNFNPFAPSPRRAATFCMYEPLMIYDLPKGKLVPWLATKYEWSKDDTKLEVTTRSGVEWSDGKPFSAKDVEFTFNLLKAHAGLLGSASSAWSDYLHSVRATSDHNVEFTFKKVYTPGLYDLLDQLIVPEHVWRSVKDPVKFANPDPVSTGPFTEVTVFRNQVYQVDRNPNYWQKGKPYFQALSFPAYAGNEQLTQALISQQIDWGGGYVPNIRKVYVDKDPKHNHFWWPTPDDTYLLLNCTKKPFDDPNVRKAISMALDRKQMIRVALNGYTQLANATGLTEYAHKGWISQEAVNAGKSWMTRDVKRANEMLDKAGLKRGPDGIRTAPDGSPMRYESIVPTGWTDWIADHQVIANNLQEIGIKTAIRTLSADTWTDKVYKGEFDITIGWSDQGPTPFNPYRGFMSSSTYKPVGTISPDNWQRYKNADADRLLDQFASTADTNEQRRISDQLQMIFVREAPVLPLYGQPDWGAYCTKRFTGFPSASNPYAPSSPTPAYPTTLIVLTTVRPV